ncbi:hypothetical protein EON65_19385 [archaeon]|nr:MAG: hypothetical protein EON65_19385 [archaeon]
MCVSFVGYVTERDIKKEEFQVIRELADSTVEKADVVLLVVDSSRIITDNYRYVFGEMVKLALKHIKKEIILVLNKVDLVQPKTRLLDTTRELVSLINGVKLGSENAHLAKLDTTTFMISALNNDGVLDLKNYLIRKADMKSWLVKEGITTLTPEEVVQEIILESLLDHTHEEIPYIADIECVSIQQMTASKVRIDVNIHLDSSRQAKIVIGEKGRTMLKIRQQSAEELEKIHKKTVLLFLWIKENKNGAEEE